MMDHDFDGMLGLKKERERNIEEGEKHLCVLGHAKRRISNCFSGACRMHLLCTEF